MVKELLKILHFQKTISLIFREISSSHGRNACTIQQVKVNSIDYLKAFGNPKEVEELGKAPYIEQSAPPKLLVPVFMGGLLVIAGMIIFAH